MLYCKEPQHVNAHALLQPTPSPPCKSWIPVGTWTEVHTSYTGSLGPGDCLFLSWERGTVVCWHGSRIGHRTEVPAWQEPCEAVEEPLETGVSR